MPKSNAKNYKYVKISELPQWLEAYKKGFECIKKFSAFSIYENYGLYAYLLDIADYRFGNKKVDELAEILSKYTDKRMFKYANDEYIMNLIQSLLLEVERIALM